MFSHDLTLSNILNNSKLKRTFFSSSWNIHKSKGWLNRQADSKSVHTKWPLSSAGFIGLPGYSTPNQQFQTTCRMLSFFFLNVASSGLPQENRHSSTRILKILRSSPKEAGRVMTRSDYHGNTSVYPDLLSKPGF